MLQVKSLVDFVQDTIQGTFSQSYDSVFAWLEHFGSDNFPELTRKGIAHGGMVLAGGSLCTHTRDTSLLTSLSVPPPPLVANSRCSSRALEQKTLIS